MNSMKKLIQLMRGNGLLYGISMITVIGAQLSALLIPIVIQYAIDVVVGDKQETLWWIPSWAEKSLLGIGGLILTLTLMRSIFLFVKGYLTAEASERIAKNIKDRVMEKLQNVKFSFYAKHDTGDLIQRATSDIETIRKFLSVQLIEVVNIIFMVVIVACLMYGLNGKLTWIALSLTPIIVVFSFWFFFTIKKRFQIADEAEGRLSAVLQENLNGIKVVKAFGREPYEVERFENVNKTYSEKVRKLVKSFAYYWSISDVMCFSQIALVVIFGSLWTIKGEMTVGILFAFITYEGMLLFPIRMLGRVLSEFGKSLVSTKRIYEVLDEEDDFKEDGNLEPEIEGNLVFENVSFSYEGSQDAIKNLSFSVNAGETIGILGPTGSGKSTIAYLMTRLFEPTEGRILLDGVDIKEIKKRYLRKNIGLILQDNFLYAKAIGENISIRHHYATEEDVVRAAKVAMIHHNIEEFDQKYDTLVGEKGVSLSGGQRQRVAIARNIIKPTKIMIFDDSLSAVDTETDQMIRNELKQNFEKATTFIISHRIQTLAETDRILVVENGAISHFGTHEELIQTEGLYKRIYEIQSGIHSHTA